MNTTLRNEASDFLSSGQGKTASNNMKITYQFREGRLTITIINGDINFSIEVDAICCPLDDNGQLKYGLELYIHSLSTTNIAELLLLICSIHLVIYHVGFIKSLTLFKIPKCRLDSFIPNAMRIGVKQEKYWIMELINKYSKQALKVQTESVFGHMLNSDFILMQTEKIIADDYLIQVLE